jgi:hypothetical protein
MIVAGEVVLVAHARAHGFDVLTWRKGFAEDVDPTLFTDLTWLDETGRTHRWRVADTTVDLPVGRQRWSLHDAAGQPARRQQQHRQAEARPGQELFVGFFFAGLGTSRVGSSSVVA